MEKQIYPISQRIRSLLIKKYHSLAIDKLMAHLCIGPFKKEINEAFKIYLNKEENNDIHLKNEIKNDMIYCYKKWLISPAEYFLYDFRNNRSDKYRASFLSDRYRTRVLLKNGGRKYFYELSDKYYFYNKTKKYFKRNCLLVSSLSDYDAFKSMAENIDFVFVKPVSSTFGNGCRVFDVSNPTKIEKTFQTIINKRKSFLVEEKIIQSKEMNQWNESSCNTVRLPCIYNGKDFNILQPVLRTGRRGDIVDNAAHGGLIALIDEKTGMLITDAVDKYGNKYICHPDSGMMFKGMFIPQWKELIDLAENLFKECLSNHKYVGFDFAYTDNGWVLIEGNWGQFIGQYVNGIGVKERFLELMNKK